MAFQEVLRTNGFRTGVAGLGIAIIGVLFAAVGLIPIAQGLVVLGILLGFIGFIMHTRLFISVMTNKDKK